MEMHAQNTAGGDDRVVAQNVGVVLATVVGFLALSWAVDGVRADGGAGLALALSPVLDAHGVVVRRLQDI